VDSPPPVPVEVYETFDSVDVMSSVVDSVSSMTKSANGAVDSSTSVPVVAAYESVMPVAVKPAVVEPVSSMTATG